MAGTRNTLTDLNNHLFEQMERLNDDSLDAEQLEKELRRADGMARIATQIIENGELALRAVKHRNEWGASRADLPPMLTGDN